MLTRPARYLFFVALVLSVPFVAFAQRPPNFIVVMADDLGLGDIGPYGAKQIATPNLDRMAAEGLKFEAFYSSANVCTPSRAGLLTGRYSVRMGLSVNVLFPNSENGLPPSEITIAEALKERGYATMCIGKWHLGHLPDYWPTNHGFDRFFGVPYSNDMTPFALYRDSEKIEEPVEQSTLTERYTQAAVEFIEENKSKPFFIYLPHTMPHIPLFASEKFSGKSKAGLYGDVVETLDWSMGEIFKALKSSGIDENTLVIFTSDNGPWYEGSSGGGRDRKGSSWEGGMRVPCIARWPGKIPAGKTTPAIGMNIDFLPTLVALAGGEPPSDRPLDGRDLSNVLLNASRESPHEALYLFNNDKIMAVRTQDWKFVLGSYYRTHQPSFRAGNRYYGPGLLFRMDGVEEESYSMTREHPEVVEKMVKLLEAGERELSPPKSE